MAEQTGWEETKAIWQKPENRMFYRLLGAALLVGIGVLVGGAIFADRAVDYQINLFTDVISIAVTVLILDLLAERRADRKAEEALKRQLVMDAASMSNEVAKNAVHQMRRKGWLMGEGGLLQEADLRRANLYDADLLGANLRRAKLSGANLQNTNLTCADLRGTDLSLANCQGAKFKVGSRHFWNVEADFDKSTILPNQHRWNQEINIDQFTDIRHPNFWQSPYWAEETGVN